MATEHIPAPEHSLPKLPPELELERAKLIAMLEEADREIDAGFGIEITEDSMRELAEDVHRRGVARFEAEAKRR